jgi:hypothetical protein
VSSCEHGNKTFDSVKGGKFFDYLCDYYLVKRDSALMRLID